jgi:flagellar biosynthesis GTPase FlhF
VFENLSFQIVERSQSVPGRQFTTAKTIEAEREILRRMREGQNHVEPVVSRPQAVAVADQHPHLNRAQKSVVEDVLNSPDRIQGIQGVAGAGKTTTLNPHCKYAHRISLIHIEKEQNIRLRAYELSEQRGRIDGLALDDWLRAKAEIRGASKL